MDIINNSFNSYIIKYKFVNNSLFLGCFHYVGCINV